MPTISQRLVVDADTAAGMVAARRDVLDERPWTPDDEASWPDGPARWDDADGRTRSFAVERGPMERYRRDVRATDLPDGRVEVEELTRYVTSLGPVWSVPISRLLASALRRSDDRQRRRHPIWAPPATLDTRAGTVLGILLSLSLVAGYLGTVLTQTVTYAADEFGRGTAAQANVLAAVRIGVLGSLVLVTASDRRGRRRLLLWSIGLCCAVTVLGAASPTIEVLGLTQTAARTFQTAAVLLLAVVAAEEMPAGARAYAVSVMSMTGALGAGIAVWALPLADVGPRGWRILFVIPLLGLPVVWRLRHRLPESKRVVRPHAGGTVLRGHARRFWAIGVALFCTSAFAAPSAQLLNDFLKDERGFSGARISLFVISTSTPAGLALVAGGRLADTRGRRWVVAAGVSGGAVLTAWSFTLAGWSMWATSLASTMLAALAVPALGAYGPELFPTGSRGRANGILQVVSVIGSAAGLIVAGLVADRRGRIADGILVLLPPALLVAVLALTVFPETARRELEEINPEDDLDPPLPPVPL